MTAHIADDAITGQKIDNITRVLTANIMGQNSETLTKPGGHGVRMATSGFSNAIYTFAVPYDYAGGDLNVREWYVVHDAGGTAKIFRTMNKMLPNDEIVGVGGSEPHDAEASCCDFRRSSSLPASQVAPGDLFWVVLVRDGDLAGDTMGRLDLKAVAVEYQADQ